MVLQFVGYLLAIVIGLSLGLIGGGGSVLALPVLVYLLHIPTKSAVAMTLVIVGVVSLIGVIPHWRKGHVNLPKALIFGSATMVGAFLGAKLASYPWVTDTFQLLLFAVLMLMAAVFMILKSRQPHARVPEDEIDLSQYPPPVCRYCWLWLLTEGLGIGVLTGLVGVGGGFAIVPALVLLGKVPMKEAIGTSLLIISLNSVAGFLGYLGRVDLDYPLVVSFSFLAALGILLGSYLSRYLKPKDLQQGFGYFLMVIAAFILFQQRDSFRQPKTSLMPTIPYDSPERTKV
ncbi:sulfite exporter TauE/SafE family protein [Synechocystis sp. LKSZ1]|uniref:sulfite exporter TauE/SafE family protein n=1 Tax=Synechocystis sp. LKSZ1 TaxID=3144951 RepID=UPI00336BFBA3